MTVSVTSILLTLGSIGVISVGFLLLMEQWHRLRPPQDSDDDHNQPPMIF